MAWVTLGMGAGTGATQTIVNNYLLEIVVDLDDPEIDVQLEDPEIVFELEDPEFLL